MIATTWITPDWPAPPNVRALITTRVGDGASHNQYGAFNLGDHVGDDPQAVAENRRRLSLLLPSTPFWLRQVHGTGVVELPTMTEDLPEADAAVTFKAETVCAVLTADCLPVLLARADGSGVAVAHAGWRGLRDGVLEQSVAALQRAGPGALLAFLGPAIGPRQFEVGGEVRDAFLQSHPDDHVAFAARPSGKWLADLYVLAKMRLQRSGVYAIHGGEFCTFQDPRFFSYRRDGQTGRMASLIWLEDL